VFSRNNYSTKISPEINHCNWSFQRNDGRVTLFQFNLGWGYIHGFRVPNAGNVVASTDSMDRTPELPLRPRIPWTERQNSRSVNGFRGPNARSIVASTDSVNRMPGVVIASTDSVNSTPHELFVWVTDSDAMKSLS
jgi:hypothetical protein